ncbi:MAG: murein DD-endopeptidase MepM [Candidatus Lightella neohaematopini]|nr:murein DD-endopeptidase MepM [Candidatus Lightella neohaematopini]MCV2528958.1 murein DD-endopeptidase MepM [Candidatus Lightella neohaematopini]
MKLYRLVTIITLLILLLQLFNSYNYLRFTKQLSNLLLLEPVNNFNFLNSLEYKYNDINTQYLLYINKVNFIKNMKPFKKYFVNNSLYVINHILLVLNIIKYYTCNLLEKLHKNIIFFNTKKFFPENINCCYKVFNGYISGNFFSSARLSGLTNNDIEIIKTALKWRINLNKLKNGDQFSVLVKLNNSSSKENYYSQLIGIRINTNGKDFYAFRAYNGKFYNLKAIRLTNNSILYPTSKKFRISSKFSFNRFNPITKIMKPHRGVDFAMPKGTPIFSVSDGKVISSKIDKAAGKYITINHDNQYITRYMHLDKLLVKSGQFVKYGDCIALSGNTGYSTGPHLHFEVWINNHAVNPLTIRLPCITKLIGTDKLKYIKMVNFLLPKLKFN